MRVGVLASGAGTNLQVILDAFGGAGPGAVGGPGAGVEVVAVATNVPEAFALQRARAAGVPAAVFPLEGYPDRAARDDAMASWLAGHGVELVVLAGYMQLVTPGFLARFPDAVINVHPALLPAFAGIRAVEQAVDYGVKVFGVTVHFVDEGVDSGPIILQRAVELPEPRTADEVRAILRPIEHELLPRAVAAIAAGEVTRDPAHPRRILVGAAGGSR